MYPLALYMLPPRAISIAVLVILVWLADIANAQPASIGQRHKFDGENGSFYIKNYGPNEYNHANQNWGVIQDQYGNMLFANGDGVLQYDSRRWTLIETPTESVIRSMVKRPDGRVFIGALDDFGYIDQDAAGRPVYASLLEKLSPDLRKMGNIWSTHCINKEIFFESDIGLFVWNDERFRFFPWKDPYTFHKSFVWRNTLYVSEQSSGLLMFDNDRLIIAPGGDVMRNIRVYAGMALGESVILGTKFDGLFRYDGKQITPFQTEANNYFKQNEIYTGIDLPGRQIAVGSKFGGVLILDESGVVKSMIQIEDGIASNGIRAMYLDKCKDLWLALEEGISHVELSNNLSIYDERVGLKSGVNDICRFQDQIYIANIDGTFVLEPAQLPHRKARFRRLPLTNGASCWMFQPMDDRLMISTTMGVFELKNGTVSRVTDNPSVAIHRFRADPDRIILAENARLSSYKLQNGAWVNVPGVDSLALDNIRFNETIPGQLWITTFSQGATLISYIDSNNNVNYDAPVVSHFGTAEGLPEGFIKVNTVAGVESFRVGTEIQLLRFDYDNRRFVKDSLFSQTFGFDSLGVFPVSNENQRGAFLMKTKRTAMVGRKLFVVERSGDRYVHHEFDMSRVYKRLGVITFWDESDSSVWHVGEENTVRQRFSKDDLDSLDFSAFISKAIVGRDSILFDGSGPAIQDASFPYELNSFRFEFTCNNFVGEEENVFQYKLEGFDNVWSEWSTENVKEYSSLWEGDYRFLVRSRDYAGRISNTQAFNITILPPWYRSIVAYVFYFIALAFLVWTLVRWRSNQLEQDKLLLQAEISRQTQEIRQQNAQLETQAGVLAANAKRLKELDTIKSNFFVNISHEFRTPLSLIIGPLEKFVADTDSVSTPELQRMLRNSKRLQQLINQLLDLAKLESGTLKIAEQKADLLYFLRVIAASFESLADTKSIRYEVHIPSGSYEVMFDRDKLETVLYNLLSNAFKFTPENGRIDLNVSIPEPGAGQAVITVRDNGPGIPAEAIDHIFDRFFQVDGSSSRAYEGSGIGLSLVREIVALLKGSVVVDSGKGAGATFKVSLPMQGLYNAAPLDDLQSQDSGVSDFAQEDKAVSSTAPLSDEGGLSAEGQPALILLIEDNKDLRDYLKESLEGDFRVVVAENGVIGLELALELVPDLILSDMMMPEMDGFTLCTHIRQDERVSHIPFVLLTARATIESKLEGLELGADDYVTKPFNLKELQVRIKNLLEQRARLRTSYSRQLIVEPKKIAVTSVDEKFLTRALELVEANLSDQQFSVERFAEEMGMSRKNLLRKIKAMTDQSVNEFIRNFRLKRAHHLIQGRSGTVSEIAYAVGFNNLSYFSKCFKELYGTQPGELLGKASVSSA